MYTFLLDAHSWLRWLVLAAALLVLVRSAVGLAQKRPVTSADKKAGVIWVSLMDLQLLLGLILYFGVSPIVAAAKATPGFMKDPVLRFWVVEHLSIMILAVAAAHVGRVLAKKAGGNDARSHRSMLIAVVISLLLLAAGIPWPGMAAARPLFR